MKEMLEQLKEVRAELRDFQKCLLEQEWPSQSIRLTANDMNTWMGMAASVGETLIGILSGLEEAKAEVKEIIEEEKGERDTGEQVQEPPDGEASGEIPPQEPGDEKPPGD